MKGVIKLNDIDKRCSNIDETYKPLHEKDGIIKHFIELLVKIGFIVQEGSIQYIDCLLYTSSGFGGVGFCATWFFILEA